MPCISCKKPFDGVICSGCCNANRGLWDVCQREPFYYSFKPKKVAKMAAPNEIALGVELEYESSSRYACEQITAAMNANLPFVYVKKDGSLQSRYAGEIVTVPACLDVHKYMWNTYFFQGPVSKHFGIEALRTCGLHVHIGRECLTGTQIAKMYGFLNYCYNQEFLAKIAGRRSDYARMAGYSRYSFGTFQCRKLLFYHGGSRYVALNIQPEETIEIRIFRSTMAKHRFFARIEFAHALATACSPGNGLRQCIKYEDFLTWLFAKKENYPYLCKYIKTLNQN